MRHHHDHAVPAPLTSSSPGLAVGEARGVRRVQGGGGAYRFPRRPRRSPCAVLVSGRASVGAVDAVEGPRDPRPPVAPSRTAQTSVSPRPSDSDALRGVAQSALMTDCTLPSEPRFHQQHVVRRAVVEGVLEHREGLGPSVLISEDGHAHQAQGTDDVDRLVAGHVDEDVGKIITVRLLLLRMYSVTSLCGRRLRRACRAGRLSFDALQASDERGGDVERVGGHVVLNPARSDRR